MIKKILIIIPILYLASAHPLSSKTGIHYYYKGKKVLKKFYKNRKTHITNKATDRLYKKKEAVLGYNKTFRVKPFYLVKTKKLIQNKTQKKLKVIPRNENFNIRVVPDKQVLWGPYTPATRTDVIMLEAYYTLATEVFIDIIPEEKLPLPLWAKSLDFWYLSGRPDLQISVYVKYPNGLESRYQVNTTNERGWKKAYINLYQGKQKKLYGSEPIYLTKIRVQTKPSGDIDNHLLIYSTFMSVYNYLQNEKNIYKQPYESFADFENGMMPKHWFFTKDEQRLNEPIATIQDYDEPIVEENKKFLNVDIGADVHQNQDIFINFPAGLYRLKRGHNISFWVNGDGKGESLSFIFEEGKGRYFELEIIDLYFKGWKKVTVKLPESIYYYKHVASMQEYIYLLGLKITPNTPERINIGIDRIEGVIEKKAIGNIKDL